MKNLTIFLIIILSVAVISASAQSKPDYSGEWVLEKASSKMSADSKIESVAITAWQKPNEIKVETATILTFAEGDSVPSSGPRVARISLGDGTLTYILDNEERVVETDTVSGVAPTKLKGELQNDGKLKLTAERTINTSNGIVSVLTQEIWELTNGGSTLKISRETVAPNGTKKNELVFIKKSNKQ